MLIGYRYHRTPHIMNYGDYHTAQSAHAVSYSNLVIELNFSNIVTILSHLSHLTDSRRVHRCCTVFIVYFGMTGRLSQRRIFGGMCRETKHTTHIFRSS